MPEASASTDLQKAAQGRSYGHTRSRIFRLRDFEILIFFVLFLLLALSFTTAPFVTQLGTENAVTP